VTSLTDQMIVAIAKARADAGLKATIASVLKEQERDENGRFAGGNSEASSKAEGLASNLKSSSGDLSPKELRAASEGHKELAEHHKQTATEYASAARYESGRGDKDSARMYSAAAKEHEAASAAHSAAAEHAVARADDRASGKSVNQDYERSVKTAADASSNALDLEIK